MKYGEGELAGDQLDEKNNVHAKTQQKLSAAMSIVINWLLQVSHHTWVAEIHGKKTNTYEKVVLPPARSAVGAELLQVAGQEPSKRRGPSEKLVGEPGTITLGLQVSRFLHCQNSSKCAGHFPRGRMTYRKPRGIKETFFLGGERGN